MRTDRPEHLKTFDYVGVYQYFLTFCTHERTRLFVKPDAVELVRTQIERAAVDFKMAVISYTGVYTIEQMMEAVQLRSDWYRRSG